MSAQTVQIENHHIGTDCPVFIIAEIGVNHNGDMELAKRTIEAAAASGVDCVKFQTWRADEFMADRELEYEYMSQGHVVREKMYTMFQRLELPVQWHKELFDYARSLGLVPLTSVADPISIDVALNAGAKALKLASEDLINLPLVDRVAQKNCPLLLSTGMADAEDIDEALNIVKANKCDATILLHCVSLYPTPDEETNLLRIKTLQQAGFVTGYSDHTAGIEACLGAVSLGACVLEKHFTLDRSLPGPDHFFSAPPEEMTALVQGVRKIEKMLGTGDITPGKAEQTIRKKFRRSVVAARDLSKGTILAREDLALKRPGTGLKAKEIPQLLGKCLRVDVAVDQALRLEDIEP